MQDDGLVRAPVRMMLKDRLPESIRMQPKGLGISPDYFARLQRHAPAQLDRIALMRQAGVDDWIDLDWLDTALRRVAAIGEQELHDVDLAIVTLQEIAQIDQDDVLSLLQLAGLCRTHDRPNILIQTLQLLVERLDEDIARTAILVELGEAHETRLKQRTAAREAYERALKLSPGYTPALRALARLYRDSGDLEGLLRLHEPEVDATSDPAVLALKAGRICFEELGDMERAIEYLWRAYRQNPDLVPAREILLQLLSATGKIRDAYDLLRAQDPPHSPALLADFHYRLGLIAEALARQGDDSRLFNEDRALQHYRAALSVQPDHGLAYERSRRLLVANHDLPNLIRLTEDQLQHASGPVKAALLIQLGRLYLGTGDLDAARRSYETAAEVAPDDGVILREYKTLLRRLGDTHTLPTLRLRLARSSEDTHYKATLLVESAEVLLQSEAPEDREFAAGAILGALKEDPGNPYAVRLLEGLLSDPNSPLAMTDAVGARAVRAQSDSERAIFYLESAELLEHAGAVNEAQRAYRAALRAMPGLAPADMGLGRLSSGTAREQATPKQKAVSVHTLMAEARDAAVRAGNTGTPEDAEAALQLLGQILGRDPHYRDAIGLTRALATQLPEPAPAVNLLSTVFGRITDAGLRYELGVFLGEQSSTDDDAVAYFTVAAQARPDGKQALRGLVRCYQQLGREAESANAMEQLLALYDPGEPSAVDLRLILAGILAQSPATMGRALEHARIVLQARGDDPRAIQLMAGLLERSQLPAEAADILERLAARERDPDRLHDLYMQRAKLLADVPGREAQALAAIEKAAELGPGNRTTILLLIRLLERSGQVDRVATYLDPIRAAMLASIGRGTVAPTDIRMLAEVAARPNPPLAQMARILCYAIEPNSAPPPDGHMRAASAPGLQNVLATPALRQMLLSPAETADISDLLACVESAMDRMYVEFTGLGPDEVVPVPQNVDVQGLALPLRSWGRLLGLEELSLRASSVNNTVALLDEGELSELFLVHAVMAEVMIAFVHTFDAIHIVACHMQRDEARAVRGERHVYDVEEDAVHLDLPARPLLAEPSDHPRRVVGPQPFLLGHRLDAEFGRLARLGAGILADHHQAGLLGDRLRDLGPQLLGLRLGDIAGQGGKLASEDHDLVPQLRVGRDDPPFDRLDGELVQEIANDLDRMAFAEEGAHRVGRRHADLLDVAQPAVARANCLGGFFFLYIVRILFALP